MDLSLFLSVTNLFLTFYFIRKYFETFLIATLEIFRAGGVQVRGINVNLINRKKIVEEPVLESYKFVPNEGVSLSLINSFKINLHLIVENNKCRQFKVIELVDEESQNNPFSELVEKILIDEPLVYPNVREMHVKEKDFTEVERSNLRTIDDGTSLVIGRNLMKYANVGRSSAMNFLVIFAITDAGAFDKTATRQRIPPHNRRRWVQH